MHLSALIAGFVCVILWLYLLLAHGRFWMVQRLGAREAPLSAIPGPIAVVIPARNEADVIGDAVHSLLQQSCAGAIHISWWTTIAPMGLRKRRVKLLQTARVRTR